MVLDAESGNFVVGNVGSTKMACEEMKTEQNYFNLLQQVNKYQVKDGYLELYINGVSVLTAEGCSMVQNYTYPLKIGSAPWCGTIKNYMDVTQFFSTSKELTVQEVQTLYGYF